MNKRDPTSSFSLENNGLYFSSGVNVTFNITICVLLDFNPQTIPVVVSPSAGTVAMRTGVQYVQTTMPVQVRRV